MLIRNKDHRSKDYSNIKDVFRPGHADYTYLKKYGLRDYRGGGRSSGRETACRVAAGAVAKKILDQHDIKIIAYKSNIVLIYSIFFIFKCHKTRQMKQLQNVSLSTDRPTLFSDFFSTLAE